MVYSSQKMMFYAQSKRLKLTSIAPGPDKITQRIYKQV